MTKQEIKKAVKGIDGVVNVSITTCRVTGKASMCIVAKWETRADWIRIHSAAQSITSLSITGIINPR